VGKIVTLGEVVADVYRERAPSEAELPFTARPGGAPANVAVAAARLGAEAGFVGRLGDDLFGDFILGALEAVGVNNSAVLRQSPPARTTLAFVEVSEDSDRRFTFYRSVPAADELLAPDDIGRDSLSGDELSPVRGTEDPGGGGRNGRWTLGGRSRPREGLAWCR
jgi:fructokinase